MHCQTCNSNIPNTFKYALNSNRCPGCGKTIMTNEVKNLWTELDTILSQAENDVGDVAIWLLSQYQLTKLSDLPKQQEITETVPVEQNKEEIVPEAKPMKLPAIKLTSSNEGQPLLDQDRINEFKKRSGVDKIKYETMVQHIQQGTDIGDGFINTSNADAVDIIDGETSELGGGELDSVGEVFTAPDFNPFDRTELKRIQRLEEMQSSGQVGKIRRST